MANRDDAIRAAQADAGDDEMLADGTISMSALNERLEAQGFDKATADERDDALTMPGGDAASTGDAQVAAPAEGAPDRVGYAHGVTALPDASGETARIKITRAMADPWPVYVNGHGGFRVPVGVETTLPREALASLETSDVQFEEIV